MGRQGEAVDPERTRPDAAVDDDAAPSSAARPVNDDGWQPQLALPAPPPPFVAPLPAPPPPTAVDPLAEPGVRAWHQIATEHRAGRPLAAPRPRRLPWRTLATVGVAAMVAAAVAVARAGVLSPLG